MALRAPLILHTDGSRRQIQAGDTIDPAFLPAFDFLSPLSAAEISVTGATTATVGRMHVCSGTSADYTLTMPSASTAGRLIGVRMASGLTKLVTVNSVVLAAGETAVFVSDGSAWVWLTGRRIPHYTSLYKSAAQSITNATATTITLSHAAANVGGMADVANNRIVVRRAGRYRVRGRSHFPAATGANLQVQTYVILNGGTVATFVTVFSNAVGGLVYADVTDELDLAAGDVLTLQSWQGSGSSQNTDAATAYGRPLLSAEEMLAW